MRRTQKAGPGFRLLRAKDRPRYRLTLLRMIRSIMLSRDAVAEHRMPAGVNSSSRPTANRSGDEAVVGGDVVDGVGGCLVQSSYCAAEKVPPILFPYNDGGSSVSNLYAVESILASAEGTTRIREIDRWKSVMCREFARAVGELWRTIGDAFNPYRPELAIHSP